MAKYRKKPVIVDCQKWLINGDHSEDGDKNYEGKVVRYFRRPDIDGDQRCELCNIKMNVHGWIDTLEGGHIVCPMDWIITEVKGEYYPCKPDIFPTIYEPVTEGKS